MFRGGRDHGGARGRGNMNRGLMGDRFHGDLGWDYEQEMMMMGGGGSVMGQEDAYGDYASFNQDFGPGLNMMMNRKRLHGGGPTQPGRYVRPRYNELFEPIGPREQILRLQQEEMFEIEEAMQQQEKTIRSLMQNKMEKDAGMDEVPTELRGLPPSMRAELLHQQGGELEPPPMPPGLLGKPPLLGNQPRKPPTFGTPNLPMQGRGSATFNRGRDMRGGRGRGNQNSVSNEMKPSLLGDCPPRPPGLPPLPPTALLRDCPPPPLPPKSLLGDFPGPPPNQELRPGAPLLGKYQQPPCLLDMNIAEAPPNNDGYASYLERHSSLMPDELEDDQPNQFSGQSRRQGYRNGHMENGAENDNVSARLGRGGNFGNRGGNRGSRGGNFGNRGVDREDNRRGGRGGRDGNRGGRGGNRGGRGDDHGNRGGRDGNRGGRNSNRGGRDGNRGGRDGNRGGRDGNRGDVEGNRGSKGSNRGKGGGKWEDDKDNWGNDKGNWGEEEGGGKKKKKRVRKRDKKAEEREERRLAEERVAKIRKDALLPMTTLIETIQQATVNLDVQNMKNALSPHRGMNSECFYTQFEHASDPDKRIIKCELYLNHIFIHSEEVTIAQLIWEDLMSIQSYWSKSELRKNLLHKTYLGARQILTFFPAAIICSNHEVLMPGQEPDGFFDVAVSGFGRQGNTNRNRLDMMTTRKRLQDVTVSDMVILQNEEWTLEKNAFSILAKSASMSGLLLDWDFKLVQMGKLNFSKCTVKLQNEYLSDAIALSRILAKNKAAQQSLEKFYQTQPIIKIRQQDHAIPKVSWELLQHRAKLWIQSPCAIKYASTDASTSQTASTPGIASASTEDQCFEDDPMELETEIKDGSGQLLASLEPLLPVNEKVVEYVTRHIEAKAALDSLSEVYIGYGIPLAERMAINKAAKRFGYRLKSDLKHKQVVLSAVRDMLPKEMLACLRRNNHQSGRYILAGLGQSFKFE